jgi:REP element-mobilizing transposase RayT
MHRPVKAPPAATFFHAMNRPAPGEAWLADEAQATAFVRALGAVAAEFPIDIHAYCVLPRHYHVVLRVEAGAVREAVARLESATSFPADGAAHVVSVRPARQLMETTRYVHLNPVTAGLAMRPHEWPWSSFAGYLAQPGAPDWLLTAAVLGRFGAIGARHRYRAYVEAGLAPGTRDALGRPRWGVAFEAGTLGEDRAWRVPPVLAPR